MAGIVVCGAGTCGLVTAMLLADDGHDVIVFERDGAAPPAPDDAWDNWERRGVNQFRLPHFLMPRFRYDMVRELPRLITALHDAGAYEFNFLGPFRESVPEPEHFDVITARRPLLEAVVARVADETPRLEVRRGVGLAGLVTGPEVLPGIPHVTGVRTEAGEEIAADLVIAATGRRSPLARWIVEAGGRAPYEEEEDSGFVYYGRYVRVPDTAEMPGPGLNEFGSIGSIVLPADHQTLGIGLIACGNDAPLRKLRHEEPWRRVLSALPGGDQMLECEPISDLNAMGGIEDRYRRFVVDGAPVATGVVAVADAWAATNPTLGRGIALGTMHALLLRDEIRARLDDPADFCIAWDATTERELTPWYRSTVWHDRHKLHDYEEAAGVRDPEDDVMWNRFAALGRMMNGDLDVAMRFLDRSGFLLEPPERLLDDPELVAKLDAVLAADGAADDAGPTRAQLLELISG